VFHLSIWGLGASFRGDKSTKAPRGNRTDYAIDYVEVVTAIAEWTWSSWISLMLLWRGSLVRLYWLA